MMNLVASGLCCCFSCCCQECSQGVRTWLGAEKTTKLFYFLLVIVFVVPSIFVFFFLNQWKAFIDYFKYWIRCPQSSGSEAFACVGSSAIFRLSLCLFCLFGLMLLIMLFRTRLSMIINQGCFCFKYILVFGLFVGSLWIDNDVFSSFSSAAQYISIGYMIIQSIILIDLFYLSGIKLVKHYDQGDNCYAFYLIFLTIVFYALALALNVLGYVSFSSSPSQCGNTLWVNILTSILLVILPLVQLFQFNPQNSLLTTSMVSLFISYLCFISQFSYEGGDPLICNRMQITPLIADIICSTFFFILTMYGSIMGGSGEVKMAPNNVSLNQALGVNTQRNQDGEIVGEEKAENMGKSQEQINLQKYTGSFGWAKWHFYMCLASIYVSMLITNWASADLTADISQLQPSQFGFWVRVAIAWATFLLYVWTMVAPRVCPGRDFTVE